jgi:hypothetical protein
MNGTPLDKRSGGGERGHRPAGREHEQLRTKSRLATTFTAEAVALSAPTTRPLGTSSRRTRHAIGAPRQCWTCGGPGAPCRRSYRRESAPSRGDAPGSPEPLSSVRRCAGVGSGLCVLSSFVTPVRGSRRAVRPDGGNHRGTRDAHEALELGRERRRDHLVKVRRRAPSRGLGGLSSGGRQPSTSRRRCADVP